MKTSHILQRYYLFLYIERKIEPCLDAQISLSIIYSTMRNKHHDMRLYFLVKLSIFQENQVYKPKFMADLSKVFVHLHPLFVVLIKLLLS